MLDDSPRNEISVSSARAIVSDLFSPSPFIYWADFLLSYFVGLYCFQQVRGGSLLVPHQGMQWTVSQAFFFVISCLLFYRSAMFIHEVVHQRTTGRLRAFRFVWNVLCGIPFLIPSFIYYTHIDHHRRHHFGTDSDGEYLALANRPMWYSFFYLSWSFVIPILAIVRFVVLTPLAWLIPGFRKFVHQRASSMVMDPTYIRPLPPEKTLRVIYLQEACCFAFCISIVVGAYLLNRSMVPLLVHVYLMSVCIVMLNSIRTLGSHRWHNDGGEMTFVEQLLDSVNYPQLPLISEIWGPVGTRFHALHHLFPSLPYHSMPEAHRRLIRELPEDSPYRLAQEPSLSSAIWRHLQKTRHRSDSSPPRRNPANVSTSQSGSD